MYGTANNVRRRIRDAITIGREEINSYFTSKGLPYTVTLYFEDTKVDPKIALDRFRHSTGRGSS